MWEEWNKQNNIVYDSKPWKSLIIHCKNECSSQFTFYYNASDKHQVECVRDYKKQPSKIHFTLTTIDQIQFPVEIFASSSFLNCVHVQKFHKTQANHFVFVKKFDGEDFLTLPLYVDDMPIVGQDLKKNASLKRALSKSLQ